MKKVDNRGGAREGSGRKTKIEEEKKIPVSFSVKKNIRKNLKK